jgi:transglutaminase-like putative cysteine protease
MASMSSSFPAALAALYGWAFACLAYMWGPRPVLFLILPLAVLAFWLRERWVMSKLNTTIGLAACLLVTGFVWQTTGNGESGNLLGEGSVAFSTFAAMTVVVFTVLRSSEETRLAIPGLCGFLLVTCTMSTHIEMVAVIGTVGVILLALALRERQSLVFSAWQLPPLLVVLLLTLVLALAATWSETRLAYLLNLFAVVPASGIRFPPTSSLDSIQKWSASDVVVFRIYGDTAPPYLVGRTFDSFDTRSFWLWKPTKQEVHPSGTVSAPYTTGVSLNLYPNDPAVHAELGEPVTVEFPDGGSGFTLYTPRDFGALATDTFRMHRYSDGLWQVQARDTFSGYYCLYPYKDGFVHHGSPQELSPELRARYLALPANLTPEVARLAQQVAGAFSDPQEKARRITAFFQTQFSYGYDFPFQSPQTALEEFLKKRPPAHCEFFATSTALMLRAQGVPTRYINGFVVQERSFDDKYFVVRLKHAHAWVEAYLPGKGWTTFDPTPPGVLESPDTKNGNLSAALEWFSNSWRKLLSWFRLSPLEMIERVKSFITSRSKGDWAGLGAGVALFYGLRYWWTRRRPRLTRRKLEPAFVAGRHESLTPLLESLQGAVHPPQWRRQAWETLEQWPARLAGSTLAPEIRDRLCAALQRYGAARYGGDAAQPELAELAAELAELKRALEGNSLDARERPRQPPV